MVWLRFFVACGECSGSDRPRSQPRTGNPKGVRRYPGKVPPHALLTTRSHPHGREKHTQNGVFCPSPQKGIFQSLAHWHERRSDQDRITTVPSHVLEIFDLYSFKTRILPPAIT